MKSPYKNKFRVSQIFKGSTHDGLDLVGVDDKNIFSTVSGVVERAGWENPDDKKQGFGLYVRIKKADSIDRYYFGHLSKIYVKVGQTVSVGQLIGLEGSTGYSTGSHCHYCVRGNASKAIIRNINTISSIPNSIGTYTSTLLKPAKSVAELAKEIIEGKWGNGEERKKKLTDAGYDYNAVQKEVNRLFSPQKSNAEIANEVIKGKWGNGAERKKKLTEAGYNPTEIQKLVNNLLK